MAVSVSVLQIWRRSFSGSLLYVYSTRWHSDHAPRIFNGPVHVSWWYKSMEHDADCKRIVYSKYQKSRKIFSFEKGATQVGR